MGKSYTYHCLGYGPEMVNGNNNITTRLYTAMNRREIAQEIRKAQKTGEYIVKWKAQTKTGRRILALSEYEFEKYSYQIPLPKMIICPACGDTEKNKHYCPVCRNSGRTTKGYKKNWQTWQLEEMQKEAGIFKENKSGEYNNILEDPGQEKVSVTISWGIENTLTETYDFNTREELDAFLHGCKESDGWLEYKIIENP